MDIKAVYVARIPENNTVKLVVVTDLVRTRMREARSARWADHVERWRAAGAKNATFL